MGNAMIRQPRTNRSIDFLAELISSVLDPADREVLCGDLAELEVTGFEKLRDVTSLLVHRQIAQLRSVQSWLVVTILAIPAQAGTHASTST